MSWARYMTLKSFRVLHPDWTIAIHESPQACVNPPWSHDYSAYIGTDYSAAAREVASIRRQWMPPPCNGAHLDPVQASDLFQWDMMSSEGGLYFDMDILFTRPLDDIYERLLKDASTVVCFSQHRVSIGFVASEPCNPFFAAVLNAAMRRHDSTIYQSCGAEAMLDVIDPARSLNSQHLRRLHMREHAKAAAGDGLCYLPDEFIYPIRFDRTKYIWNQDSSASVLSQADCYGLHWFGGDTLSQQWNNTLNDSNFREHNNTFCSLAKILVDKK